MTLSASSPSLPRSSRSGRITWNSSPPSRPISPRSPMMLCSRCGDLAQQLVAGRVAHRVVDVLEPVEVEHHQRARALGRLVGAEDAFEPPVHPVAVGEAGQRIVLGHPRIRAACARIRRSRPWRCRDSPGTCRRRRTSGGPRSTTRSCRSWHRAPVEHHAHGQVVDLAARVELEVERAVAASRRGCRDRSRTARRAAGRAARTTGLPSFSEAFSDR